MNRVKLLAAILLGVAAVGAVHAKVISLNIHATDDGGWNENKESVDGTDTYGIAALDTVVGNWNNTTNLVLTSLVWDNALLPTSTVEAVIGSGRSTNWEGAYDDSPLKAGMSNWGGYTNSITLTNLAENFPEGYYAVVYATGWADVTGAALSDGNTTYYYQTPDPADATRIQITDTDSTDGYAIGNYAVFGSTNSPLTADSFEVSLFDVLAGGAFIGGIQLVSLEEEEQGPTVVVHYLFDEPAGGFSTAVDSAGSDIAPWVDNANVALDGVGQAVISGNIPKQNAFLGGSSITGGKAFLRVDYGSWSGPDKNTQIGMRMRDEANTQNLSFDVTFRSNTGPFNGNINCSASGAWQGYKWGLPNTNLFAYADGMSLILEVDLDADTWGIWHDVGITGTYTQLAADVSFDLLGITQFRQVNAISINGSEGTIGIDRMALGTNFDDLAALGTAVANPAITAIELIGGQAVIRWESESDQTYTVSGETDLGGAWMSILATNLAATPPENAYTNSTASQAAEFFRVEVE